MDLDSAHSFSALRKTPDIKVNFTLLVSPSSVAREGGRECRPVGCIPMCVEVSRASLDLTKISQNALP